MMTYLGYSKDEDFAKSTALYGDISLLYQVSDETKRMTRFTMHLEEVIDPVYASAGIPFDAAEPLNIHFKVDNPDA